MSTMSIKQLEKLYMEAKDKYYNSDKSIMSDYEFDELEEKIRKLNPKSKVFKVIGAEVKNGVKLPFNMMSLNKRKEDKEINKWLQKYYKEDIYLTDKLDGLSVIGHYNNGQLQLLTRGDGQYGLDITKIAKYMNLPQPDINMIVRGEIIMKKSIFNDKYKSNYANARNLVSGAILRKNIVKEVIENIDIVWYSVYYPEKLIYSKQLDLLNKYNFRIVHNTNIGKNNKGTLNKICLTGYLKERSEISDYNIDGIVVQYNESINTNLTKNPENAFAFKINGEIKEVNVIRIDWNISKHNKMIPVIVIEPTKISEVVVKQITGINAKYIQDNKIGAGSVVTIVRSGEVIPKVVEVVNPLFNIKVDFPKNYSWRKDGYHIIPDVSKDADDDQKIKMLDDSFKKLGVADLNIATIGKLYNAGYNTLMKILTITVEELLKLDNFKEKMANKLYNNINRAYNQATFATIMDFSNLLGENIAIKNIKLILKHYPNILKMNEKMSKKELVEKLNEINGIGPVKAELFASNINTFATFFGKLPKQKKSVNVNKTVIQKDSRFKNKNVVFSGIRDKKLEEIIEESGGKVLSTINKDTNILIIKDKNTNSSKIVKARELNVMIMNHSSI
jgi:DNA ligase (NAD+)